MVTPRIPLVIATELCNILDISIFFMNMLAFDPVRAMSCDFLRVSQYFTIPPKLYTKNEDVVRLDREVGARGRRRATSD